MRRQYWEKSMVTGQGEGGAVSEEVLHLRSQDPIVMAVRRNNALARCGRIRVETAEAFMEMIKDDYRTGEIERNRSTHEWDWIGGSGKAI